MLIQTVDLAIAEKIVSLHSNSERLTDKVYSQEEVLRYITFARHFKPIIGRVSTVYIVKYIFVIHF